MNDCEHRLTADLAALRAEFTAFKELVDERHERYGERDKANKESVATAFAAAEKISQNTEASLKEYKTGANEWRDTVKDLIASLEKSLARRSAAGAGMERLWGWIAFGIMTGIATVGIFLR